LTLIKICLESYRSKLHNLPEIPKQQYLLIVRYSALTLAGVAYIIAVYFFENIMEV